MYIDQRKEQFSRAYVQAVAAVAGFTYAKHEVDDDSVDLQLAASSFHIALAPRVEMQIKCTGGDTLTGTHLIYDLKYKNYCDLQKETLVPRILVVVLVPKDISEWLSQDEVSLGMSRCGYWLCLQNQAEVTNQTKVRVKIPRGQVFNVSGLQEIMNKVSQRQPL